MAPKCTDTAPERSFPGQEEGTGAGQSGLAGQADTTPSAGSGSPEPAQLEDVRGQESPRFAVLPLPQLFNDPDELPAVLGLAVLALLAVSLAGILVEVIRNVRSPQA